MKLVSTCALMLLLVTVSFAPASADEAEECSRPQELDRYHLLRRLSLDLKHELPTYEEYLELDVEADVPESTLDAYLESDRFRIVARRFHEKLLWPNVQTVQLTAFNYRISRVKGAGGNTPMRFPASPRANTYRGDSQTTCLNEEQKEWITFTVDGVEYNMPKPIEETIEDGKVIQREGYVWVHPYWEPDPTTVVKVCAFDAQETQLVPALNKSGEPLKDGKGNTVMHDCAEGRIYKLCGAGPNLMWSWGSGVDAALWSQMREQMLLLVDDHTVGGHPYSTLLTTERTYENGRTNFFKQHLAHLTSLNKTFNRFMPGDAPLPESPDFNDLTWQETMRNTVNGEWVDKGHSGILTLAAYTLRFQTNRARANRFRTVFTKQYFVPSDIPESPETHDCSVDSDDLTQRCTCRGCHQVLEPLAAHWGKVAEAGSALISNTTVFPVYNPQCDPTAPTFKGGLDCARFYVVDSSQPNPGVLLAHQFAYVDESQDPATDLDTLHYEIFKNLEAGPRAAAEKITANGQFHSAMVQNLFEHFMGRPMNLNPGLPDNEIALLSELSEEFQAHDDFKMIVKRIVLLPQYRRVQ